MTGLEHGLYGGAIVYKSNPQLYWFGFIAGILPDIPPMVLSACKVGIKKTLRTPFRKSDNEVPESVFKLYDITHSFIIAFFLLHSTSSRETWLFLLFPTASTLYVIFHFVIAVSQPASCILSATF